MLAAVHRSRSDPIARGRIAAGLRNPKGKQEGDTQRGVTGKERERTDLVPAERSKIEFCQYFTYIYQHFTYI